MKTAIIRSWNIRLPTLVVNDNPPGTFDDQVCVVEPDLTIKSVVDSLYVIQAERDSVVKENERLKALVAKVEDTYLTGSDSEWGHLFIEIQEALSRDNTGNKS